MRKDRNTGIVRKLDSLGRVVLPKELRDTLGIEIGDPLEYFADDDNERILLRTYRTLECMFCFTTKDLSYFKDYFICRSCLKQVSGNDKFQEKAATKPKETVFEEILKEKDLGIKLKQTRSKKTISQLTKIMEEYPDASQKEWADLIGISQGRVSQLVKKLKESDRGFS